MGLLNIKQTPEQEANALINVAIKYIEKKVTEYILEYLDKFEPDTYKRLLNVSEIEKQFKDSNDVSRLKKDIYKWMSDWNQTIKKISNPITNTKKAKIHILKKQLDLSEKEYRELMLNATSKRTAKYMDYFEGCLVIRVLEDKIKIKKIPLKEIYKDK